MLLVSFVFVSDHSYWKTKFGMVSYIKKLIKQFLKQSKNGVIVHL